MSWQLTALIAGAVSLCLAGLLISWLAASRRFLRLAAWLLFIAGALFLPLSGLFFLAMGALGQGYDVERRLVIFCICLAGCIASFVRGGFVAARIAKMPK